jgi:hypothetical protein
MSDSVRLVRDLPLRSLTSLLDRYGLTLCVQDDGAAIVGSFWGDSEAGIVGCRVFVRSDTPIHSLLHETCHVICMTTARRDRLDRDAGGSDLEEAAVCYLQVILAGQIAAVGSDELMRDMDSWGYSFRLGSTRRWFEEDAEDAIDWLLQQALLSKDGLPTFTLRA